MDRLTAFQFMVLSIAEMRTIRDMRGIDMPAQILEAALLVNERDLGTALAEDSDLSGLAAEFVHWQMSADEQQPAWIPTDLYDRQLLVGGEPD